MKKDYRRNIIPHNWEIIEIGDTIISTRKTYPCTVIEIIRVKDKYPTQTAWDNARYICDYSKSISWGKNSVLMIRATTPEGIETQLLYFEVKTIQKMTHHQKGSHE